MARFLGAVSHPALLESVNMLDEVDAPMAAEKGLELVQGADRVVGAGQKADMLGPCWQGRQGFQPGERCLDHGPLAPGHGDPSATVQRTRGPGGLAEGLVEGAREIIVGIQVQVEDNIVTGVKQAPGQPCAERRMLVNQQQESGSRGWMGPGQNQRPRFISPSSTSWRQSSKRRETLPWNAGDRSRACSA